MKRKRKLAVGALLVTSAWASWAATIQVPGDYPTLGQAVAAAGSNDTIQIAAGVYVLLETVIVDKPLTIRGPQAGVDPRPSSSSTRLAGEATSEAILDGDGALGTLVSIRSDDVILEGLEFRDGTNDLIESPADPPVKHRPTIRYCILHQATGDEGIQLRLSIDALIEYNHVYETSGDAINVCCGSERPVIRFNEIHTIYSPDAAIYLYDGTETGPDFAATIAGNLVYDVIDNDGIKLGHKWGLDAHRTGGQIVSNVIHHTTQDGITVYTSRTLVEGNDISQSVSENGAIFLDFDLTDVRILNNYIHDNGPGVHPWLPGDCTPCDPGVIHGPTFAVRIGKCNEFPMTGVVVSNNCIFGNVEGGLVFSVTDAAFELDARGNWWGDPTGPAHSSNPGGLGDRVTDCVDYSGWLRSCPLGVLGVDLDIKPGSFPNSINLGSRGTIAVAILSSETFDARTVDPSTVVLAGATVGVKGKGTLMASIEDVNKDGLPDLVVHVSTEALELSEGDTEAILQGETYDHTPITGTDSIRIVR